MVKSSSKISNIGLFFLGNFGWVTVMADSADELGMNTESEYSFSQREQAVQRARKIVNSALFEAIKQGSLDGVAFLIERGADLSAENKQGRTPLDFAAYLAEKYPEEPEWQAIVDVLNNWDSEQYAVDDATIINGAREIWGLNGGGWGDVLKAGKKVVEVVKKVAAPKIIEKAVQSKTVKNAVESGAKAAKKSLPKPLAKAVPSTERIVNTLADCTKYMENMISKGICRKTSKRFQGQALYEVTKKDGILKKGDYIYRDAKHNEIELMRSDMVTHKGAIDPKTGNLYKEGVPGRNLRSLK
jgi:hypothetical protein